MKADFHVHSDFSFDSSTPMEAQIERAIELGVDELCFTEHVDYGVMRDWDDPGPFRIRNGEPYRNVDYPRYFAALAEMKRRYAGKITLRQGLELGVQRHTIGQNNALFETYRGELDFTLLSVHQVDNMEFYPPEYMEGRTQDEYNLGYFEELLAVARDFDHYCVLAHLDVMRRYDPAGEYPFEKNRDIIAEILRTAIQKGKGIELNTASWRYKLDDIQPRRAILRLYRDLGGEILTIGSDAHRPERVAGNFGEARAILRDELGFRRFCTFAHMEPTFHEL
ncbi:MAG: histidinol-phosphatase HisJ family protein [Ruminococcaceae bacterium]|jgi:histidinol-phosphatase (PHP family)|nr:histidinol-phosphatase HisJ family protein [Oscillospiraceae bacterium]